MKTMYLAGGCFWGCQKYFDLMDGVQETPVYRAQIAETRARCAQRAEQYLAAALHIIRIRAAPEAVKHIRHLAFRYAARPPAAMSFIMNGGNGSA